MIIEVAIALSILFLIERKYGMAKFYQNIVDQTVKDWESIKRIFKKAVGIWAR